VAVKVGGYEDAQNINLIIPLNLGQNLLSLVGKTLSGASIQSADHKASRASTQSADHNATRTGSQCESFLQYQGDESHLALLAEKAFAQQNYACVIVYLEQAKKVQSSKVWERDYPYLAAAYMLDRKDKPLFEATLKEMLAEMRLNNSFLHFGTPIGMVLQNLTDVRQYLNSDAQLYIDSTIIPSVIVIKSNLGT
jgi:hypothetical protein